MNKSETTELMQLITAFDRRTIGVTEIEAWSMALSDIPWDETVRRSVVEFYNAPPDKDRFIMPHHIRAFVAKVRNDRLAVVPEPVPNDVDGVDYIQELRAVRRAIAEGRIASEDDAERYREWGGSLHLAYRRTNAPAIGGPSEDAQPMRQRPVAALLSRVFPLRPPTGDE